MISMRALQYEWAHSPKLAPDQASSATTTADAPTAQSATASTQAASQPPWAVHLGARRLAGCAGVGRGAAELDCNPGVRVVGRNAACFSDLVDEELPRLLIELTLGEGELLDVAARVDFRLA